MIYIDDRAGSGTLLPLFQSHRTRPAVSLRRLPAADFCFSGHGPKGPCLIGVERKLVTGKESKDSNGNRDMQFRDALSSIQTGRIVEQVTGLLDHYEFSYIIVEGIVRTNPETGMLEEWFRGKWDTCYLGRQPWLAARLYNALDDITWHYPVRILHSSNERQTVEEVMRLVAKFGKLWEKRHGHEALHRSPETATIGKAGTVRRVAYALAGVGWDRSATVATHFKSVAEMVMAEPRDWAKLDGFGKVLSKRVWQELHGQFDSGDGLDL